MERMVMGGKSGHDALSLKRFGQGLLTRGDVNALADWCTSIRPLNRGESISNKTAEQVLRRLVKDPSQLADLKKVKPPPSKALRSSNEVSKSNLPDGVNLQVNSTGLLNTALNYVFYYNSGPKNVHNSAPTPITITRHAIVSQYRRVSSNMLVEVSIPLDELEYESGPDLVPNIIYNIRSIRNTSTAKTKEHTFVFWKDGRVQHRKGTGASDPISDEGNGYSSEEFRGVEAKIQAIRARPILAEIRMSSTSLENVFPEKKSQKTFPITIVATPREFKVVAEENGYKKERVYLTREMIRSDTDDAEIVKLPDKPVSCTSTMFGLGGIGKNLRAKSKGNIAIILRDKMENGCFYCEIITPLSRTKTKASTFLQMIEATNIGKPLTMERLETLRTDNWYKRSEKKKKSTKRKGKAKESSPSSSGALASTDFLLSIGIISSAKPAAEIESKAEAETKAETEVETEVELIPDPDIEIKTEDKLEPEIEEVVEEIIEVEDETEYSDLENGTDLDITPIEVTFEL